MNRLIIIFCSILVISCSRSSYSVFYDESMERYEFFDENTNTVIKNIEDDHMVDYPNHFIIIIDEFSPNDVLYIANKKKVYHNGRVIVKDYNLSRRKIFYVENKNYGNVKIKISNKKFIIPVNTYLDYKYVVISYDYFKKESKRYDISLQHVFSESTERKPELGNNARKILGRIKN